MASFFQRAKKTNNRLNSTDEQKEAQIGWPKTSSKARYTK